MIYKEDGTVCTLSYEAFVRLAERMVDAYDAACQASRKYRDKTDPSYRMAWSGFYDAKREMREAISTFRFNQFKFRDNEKD